MGRKSNVTKKFLKLAVVIICLTGFLLQTLEFLFLYWTYPTVVDIQVSVPSDIDMPGISLCSHNGFKPDVVCKLKGWCTMPRMFNFIDLCSPFPIVCGSHGKPPEDFRAVSVHGFMSQNDLNQTVLDMLRIPLKDFFKCKITSGAQKRDCDMDNVIYGSYYSDSKILNFCFTLNSLWSDPTKKIQKIKKSEKIEMEFYMDISNRDRDAPPDLPQRPKYNYPGSPAVQLAIHSPYLTVNPFVSGQGFLGGKRFQIKVKQDEKHLLPPPYQTNCTDYMPLWLARGGVGPLNQIMVIEECKLNATVEEMGCVPFSVDYPHNETVCKYAETYPNMSRIGEMCTELLQYYNQPCDFITYDMEIEEKLVYVEKFLESRMLRVKESLTFKEKGHNCTFERIWTRECQTAEIEIVFDDFQITNVTYNPKFESLELFSVIGGYMGMYLGVSIVAVYDFAEILIGAIYKFFKKREAAKKKTKIHRKKDIKRHMDNFRFSAEFRRRAVVPFAARDVY